MLINVIHLVANVKHLLCYAESVPSNQSSDEIDHDSNEDCAEPENVDPPFPPNRPNSINAHSISESEVEADVKDLQDRLKSDRKVDDWAHWSNCILCSVPSGCWAPAMESDGRPTGRN